MTAIPATCHAITLQSFGDDAQLVLRSVPVAALTQPDAMLVRVRATGVNPIEWKMRQGLIGMRVLGPRVLGKPMILGMDFAGEVAAVGPKVTDYRVGDAVFGAVPWGGTYSEYMVVRPSDRRTAVAHMPRHLTYTDVGAAPFAALVAYAGLVTEGGLPVPAIAPLPERGPRILVVGASGGVGHLAVQIAKHGLGASYVVGVCSSRNAAFARQCGADVVIEHDRTPIEDIARQHPEWRHSFDLIFDTIGVDAYYTVLAPYLLKQHGGRFVTAALPPSRPGKAGEDIGIREGIALAARMGWRRLTGRYRLITGLFGGLPTKDGFRDIVRWMDEGKIAVREWKRFDLAQMREAHRASQTGAAVGKIVIEVP